MARTYWNIYIYSGGSWVADGQIPVPNDTLDLGLTSTLQKIQLADGDQAFIVPETKYNKDNLTFIWRNDTDGSIKSKIESYVQNNTKVKIVDSLSNEHIGRFTNIRSHWIVGIETTYDIEAEFVYEN